MENDITTGAAAHTQDDEGRWGTVAETAQVFGVSADTIRRRMKRGELEARRQQTPQDRPGRTQALYRGNDRRA